jgi:hypothetical protein
MDLFGVDVGNGRWRVLFCNWRDQKKGGFARC